MAARKADQITLGAHEYTVVAQPLGYLEVELGDVFGGLGRVSGAKDLADVVIERGEDGTTTTTSAPARSGFGEIAGPGYDILRVFIPDLMPEHEFRGFASEEAMAAGVRDRGAARLTPTVPQIAGAFETIVRVNRLDVVKHLGKIISPTLLQTFLKQAVGEQVSQLFSSSLQAPGASG